MFFLIYCLLLNIINKFQKQMLKSRYLGESQRKKRSFPTGLPRLILCLGWNNQQMINPHTTYHTICSAHDQISLTFSKCSLMMMCDRVWFIGKTLIDFITLFHPKEASCLRRWWNSYVEYMRCCLGLWFMSWGWGRK